MWDEKVEGGRCVDMSAAGPPPSVSPPGPPVQGGSRGSEEGVGRKGGVGGVHMLGWSESAAGLPLSVSPPGPPVQGGWDGARRVWEGKCAGEGLECFVDVGVSRPVVFFHADLLGATELSWDPAV